mmetsp:Transcript_18955/g.33674  ORF Transcript_18955/g.33674 Transcript_18955/m.33674 type:complete len:678 (-) Transcript_18955:64-2097(-)
MLLDVSLREGTLEASLSSCLATVYLLEELLEAKVLELLTGEPSVHVLRLLLPLDLVLKDLTLLTATEDLFYNALLLDLLAILVLVLDLDGLLHLSSLLVRDLNGGLYKSLLVLTTLEAPLDVLVGGLVEMILDVMERMLSNVSELAVGVLVHHTAGGLELTGENLNHGRLTSTVGTYARNTGSHGYTYVDVHELGLVAAGVGEAYVGHGKNGASLGLYTIEGLGGGERELESRCGQVKVRLSVGEALYELRHVTLVAVELEGIKVDDVGSSLVEELHIVRNNERGNVLHVVAGEVVHNPLYVEHIQVVGGLIHEKDISLAEHSAGKRELHALSTRERGNGVSETSLEAGVDKSSRDLLVRELHLLLNESLSKVKDVETSLGCRDIGLHKDSLEAVHGEALNLAVSDRGQEGGLTSTLGSNYTVAHTTAEEEASVVEKNTGTVCEREAAIAKKLALRVLLVLLKGLLETTGSSSFSRKARLHDCLSNLLSSGLLLLGGNKTPEGSVQGFLPVVSGSVLVGSHDLSRLGGKLEANLLCGAVDLAGLLFDDLLNSSLYLLKRSSLDLGHLASTLGDVLESLMSSSATSTALGVSDLLCCASECGLKNAHKGCYISWVVHELGQVLGNYTTLALYSGLLLAKATLQQGNGHTECGGVYGLHKGGSRKCVYALLDLGGVGNA